MEPVWKYVYAVYLLVQEMGKLVMSFHGPFTDLCTDYEMLQGFAILIIALRYAFISPSRWRFFQLGQQTPLGTSVFFSRWTPIGNLIYIIRGLALENAIQHRDWSRSRLNGEIVITWHFDQVPVVKPYLVGGLILFSPLFSNSTYIYFFHDGLKPPTRYPHPEKTEQLGKLDRWILVDAWAIMSWPWLKLYVDQTTQRSQKLSPFAAPHPHKDCGFCCIYIYIYQAKKGTVYSSFFVSSASHNFSNIQVQ